MSFKDQNWEERIETLGDPAENAFRKYAAQGGIACVKYGLDRPPLDLSRTPSYIRYTPDFLTNNGLVEVQGCGRDQCFKFKHDKLRALLQWQRHHHVDMWLWNEPLDDWRQIPLTRIATMCRDSSKWTNTFRVDGAFDGSKPFSSVPWIDLI